MKRRAGRQNQISTGTALKKYQRLEAVGLWRETPEEQRREVILHMGEATLILSDPRSEVPLSHWSLPAVQRLNPGLSPAVFSPGEDSGESVEIEDEEMLSALKTVHSVLRKTKPHPGRLRGFLIGGAALAVAALAALLPGALISHTTSVVPVAKRAEIGMRALDDVIRLSGAPCDGPEGLAALAALSERLFGPQDTPLLYILPEGLSRAAHLPGGVILLPRSLIAQDAPDALAGAALAEYVAAQSADPLRDILSHGGVAASFELLTSGNLPASALEGYGETLLQRPAALPDQKALTAAFSKAQVTLTPWARWLDPTGAVTAELIAADPFANSVPGALMRDDDWIALQSACSGA